MFCKNRGAVTPENGARGGYAPSGGILFRFQFPKRYSRSGENA